MQKAIVSTLIIFTTSTATTLKVPSQYSTIQAAIDAATAGDTVLVADGTYTENLDIDKDIKIISENGAEKTIIDGGEIKWVLGFGSSTTRACLLEGFTVTNGGNANGDSDEPAGGINVWGGSPTLKNLIIRNNKRLKYSGGGIQVTGNGNPLIADCTIKDNSVEYWHGGGITIWESSAELKNCVISNNTSPGTPAIEIGNPNFSTNPTSVIMDNVEVMNHSCTDCGSAINAWNTMLTLKNVNIHDNKVSQASFFIGMEGEEGQVELRIEDSDFSRNYASDGSGGAVGFHNLQLVRILNTTFSSDSSKDDGGAIYSWNTDSLFIDNSTFDGNISTDGNGGAITFKGDENSTLYCEIKNTTFENNSGGWGGAIAAFEPINMNIYSVFATGNKASGNGGFIELCCGASVSITNSTIYNNDSNNNDLNGCSDCKMFVTNSIIWKDKIGGPSDATIEITYSDIEGGWDGEGNIDADPHFIDAANGDYHIGDYSPCIGAGVYSAQFDDTWYYAPSTDLDGNPRPNPAGSMPDMGAYENPRATPQHAPEPFELVFPFDSTHIGITRHNYLDTLYFAWNKAIDIDGDAVRYRPILTGDLTRFFLITSNTDTTIWKIPYHHVEHYMHTEGIEFAQGTWTMVASDGGMDTYASNGPFLLTIDASAVTVDNEAVLPESFALHANYPNPFNPSTTISYDLPEQAQVTLGIYDLLGKQIKTLVNQSQDAGNRIAVWDGTDDLGRPVSAGVYLYQIQAGEFSQTRKMLLLK